MTPPPDDLLDGCELVGREAGLDPWADDELDGLVLFCDVNSYDPIAVARRADEWREVFGS